MDRYQPEQKVKPIGAYLKEALKFYELDKPMPARIVFLLELAILFGGYLIAFPYTVKLLNYFDQVSAQLQGGLTLANLTAVQDSVSYINLLNTLFTIILIYAAIRAVSFLIALCFGAYYFFGLTNPEMSGSARIMLFMSRLPKLIIFNILFYIVFYFGVLALILVIGIILTIVPFLSFATFLLPLIVIALNVLFVFKDLLIIEFDIGVFKNFRKSLDITRNNRRNVIVNMMWPTVIGWLLNAFTFDANNAALSIFISSFLEVIVLLVGQRLSVLMFIDAASLERKDKKKRTVDTTV